MSIPVLNTLVLLTSGATVTWSHACLCSFDGPGFVRGLGSTLLLGLFFSILQGYEYYICSFTISDSAYGSCFFLATGFHGIHVIIGTLFLSVSLLRFSYRHYSASRHLGFLFAC